MYTDMVLVISSLKHLYALLLIGVFGVVARICHYFLFFFMTHCTVFSMSQGADV